MPSSIHSQNYQLFREMLVNARLAAGLTQVELARQIQKPQSYVSKYERGERRVDFAEFIHIGTILKIDPQQFIAEYLQKTSA